VNDSAAIENRLDGEGCLAVLTAWQVCDMVYPVRRTLDADATGLTFGQGLRVPSMLLWGLLSVACGGPTSGSQTTTGITTAPADASSSGSTDSSSMGSGGESSTGSSTGTSSGEGSSPDLPEFDTLGPMKGCSKLDILFVIDDAGYFGNEGLMEETKAYTVHVRDSTNTFIGAMQAQAADYDLQVMVVKGDRHWEGSLGHEICCDGNMICDELGSYPCQPKPDQVNACDSVLGAGVRFPVGFMASNRDCELAGGHRYITEAQEDFGVAFDCVLNVGRTGTAQKYNSAMVQAVGPSLTGEGECNAGFIRPDAMLVVVMLVQTIYDNSPGTPEGWAASLVAAKGGDTEGVVMVGILGAVDYPSELHCVDIPDDETLQMVESFPNHVLGSYCAPDQGVYLSEAIGVIEAACAEFVPPG